MLSKNFKLKTNKEYQIKRHYKESTGSFSRAKRCKSNSSPDSSDLAYRPVYARFRFGQYWLSFTFYSFLMANVNNCIRLTISSITPLWSVGVEEQFYLFWPWLMKHSKNTLWVLLSTIAIYFMFKLGLWFYDKDGPAYVFIGLTRIDLMAFGGIGAYLFTNRKTPYLRILHHPITQLLGWSLFAFNIFFGGLHVYSFIDTELNATASLIVILNVSSNTKSYIKLENSIFNYFGKISYGFYMYHMAIILVCGAFFKGLLVDNFFCRALVFIVIISATTLLAHLSFFHMEKRILMLKKKYTIIPSRG